MAYIIYEQPLTELVRVSLRLEHLFKQLDIVFKLNAKQATQFIIQIMVDIINMLDRTDLKSKLSKEFERYLTIFSRLHSFPNVSQETLNVTLYELKKFKDHFITTEGKIAQNLRNNEFLRSIRQGLLSPGGDSCIDVPAYHYWLNLSDEIHKKQIKIWLSEFKEIREAISLLLRIIRNSSEAQEHIADSGFYHTALNPQNPCQLIRVALSNTLILYPEISASRHRINIRFVIPSIESRPQQTSENIRFKLTKCAI
jgi:cell division protein ZapD